MTPEELRADIPATEEAAYFNTGASGPAPRRVVEAVSEFQARHEFEAPAGEGMYPVGREALEEVRGTVGGFLDTDPRRIALTESTAESIALIAESIDWEPGDTVVRTDVEHPAGTLPWRRLRDLEGIDVTVVEGDRGRFDPDDFAAAVADARLVCLSAVAWNYGTRLPVEEIAGIAHEAGALVLVDAVQAVGHLPVDPEAWGVNFLAASGHKWPLGPWGTGILYLDDAARERLAPKRIGGAGVTDPLAGNYEYKQGGAMFDLSTKPVAVYRGLEAALETVEAVGIGRIRDRIERLTGRLKDGIPDDRLLSPEGFESGLVAFEAEDPEATAERLAGEGIVLRSVTDPGCVRASVHAFNTAAEVDGLIGAL